MQTYDLIIVGGGPAGATAALYAQRHGLAALLLDKQCFPRDKVCGDALSGKTVAILHELGLFEEVCDLPGAAVARIVFGSPDATAASIDLSRYDLHNALTGRVLPMEGFVIRREVFDDFLFAKARAAAAQTLEGFAVRELLREGEQVCGVRGRTADGTRLEFRAPLVLGCDGFNSIVARKSGLYRHESRDWMVALRQYFEGVAGLSDQIELHFIDEVRPGYFWIFPHRGRPRQCRHRHGSSRHQGARHRPQGRARSSGGEYDLWRAFSRRPSPRRPGRLEFAGWLAAATGARQWLFALGGRGRSD